MSDVLPVERIDLVALAVRTLTLYSLAEFQAGHASTIRVHANGGSFAVADDGRGHAIGRSVNGTPYLRFVYTHLEYPFGTRQSMPVQLHGIGISLLNSLCSQLSVVARRSEATLRMVFADGALQSEEVLAVASSATGNAISGTLRQNLQPQSSCVAEVESWLRSIVCATPQLRLYFDDRELRATSAV